MKHDEHILTYYPDVRCEKHMIEVFPEACLEFVASGDKAVANVPVDFAVEDGKSYCVTFDLVEHEIKAAGGVIAADRFSISASGGQMTVSVAEPGHHSVRIVGCEEVFTKLPSEYLPEGAGGGLDLAELEKNPLSGKYVEGMGYEEDGVIHPVDQKFLPSGNTIYFVQSASAGSGDGFLYHTEDGANNYDAEQRVTKSELEAAFFAGAISVKDLSINWYYMPSFVRFDRTWGEMQVNGSFVCVTSEYFEEEG